MISLDPPSLIVLFVFIDCFSCRCGGGGGGGGGCFSVVVGVVVVVVHGVAAVVMIISINYIVAFFLFVFL